MSLSEEWSESTPGSASKKNLTSVITGDGAYLSGLDKTKFKIVTCDSTGSGFTVNHVYLFSADGTTAIDLTQVAAHTHTSSTDGGGVAELFTSNPTFIDTGSYFLLNQAKARWVETVTSTGSVADDTDGTTGELSIKLATGATSGSGSTIAMKGMKLNFAKTAMFQAKVRIGTATSIALHSGVNPDNVTAADSNTIKFNAEVCTATNNNWFLRTANGTTNSTSDTGLAMTTTRTALKIIHLPTAGTPETDLYVNDGTNSTSLQKTSHIPVSGATDVANLMKHSLKNSAASDRTYFVYGNRLAYYINDTWI